MGFYSEVGRRRLSLVEDRMIDPDISNPPSFDSVPDNGYADVMPDDEEFEMSAFDIGVIEYKVERDFPPPKPRAEPRPRKKPEARTSPEMLEEFIQLPDELMDTVIGRIAATMAHCIEFPEASVFMTMLATASAAVSCSYAVQYPTKHAIGAGLYVIVEQPPATQKSRILDSGMVPYSMAMRAHNKKVAARHRQNKERDLEPDTGLMPGFVLATDATSAAMDKALSECSEGRFVVASAEQSALISLFPEANSFASTNELILKGYAGEYVAGMRGGRAAFSGIANGTVVLIAQMGANKRVLAASNGSGMAERFIFVSEPTLLGSRTFDKGYVTAEDKKQFDDAIYKCVESYSNRILSFKNSDLGTRIVLDPENLDQLKCSSIGYHMIRQYRIDNEPRMGHLSQSGDMVLLSWLGKFETHVLKIAAVIHVFECLGNGVSVPEVIPDKVVRMAMDLVEVLSHHMEVLLHDAGESGNDAEEQAVIEALTNKRLATRALTQILRHRKPFKAMGKGGYQASIRRVEKMVSSGQLLIKPDGVLEIV